MRIALLLGIICANACTVTGEPVDEHDPLDYEELAVDEKADGVLSSFRANRLVSDAAFFDTSAIDAAGVQRFFEMTPYGRRSFLAGVRLSTGELLSSALVRVAAERGLNPVVLLVTLQKEGSLVARSTMPSQYRLDFAFGCGCPDGGSCNTRFKGIDRQLACAADVFRAYADALEAGGTTVSGWKPGVPKRALDGISVTPANRATAMLYTYTPWIQQGYGGNWLFWNIWRRYSRSLGYEEGMTAPFNEGFIGGACSADDQCYFSGGVCGSDGTCTKACTSTCPDQVGGFARTFCVTGDSGQGTCVAQCDAALSGTASGCEGAQVCQSRTRHSDASVARQVCTLP